jgi:hypothetical protein
MRQVPAERRRLGPCSRPTATTPPLASIPFIKVVEQQDFYIDTERIVQFYQALDRLGVRRISSQGMGC